MPTEFISHSRRVAGLKTHLKADRSEQETASKRPEMGNPPKAREERPKGRFSTRDRAATQRVCVEGDRRHTSWARKGQASNGLVPEAKSRWRTKSWQGARQLLSDYRHFLGRSEVDPDRQLR